MKDLNKTKKQLVDELANLRSRIAEMEAAVGGGGRAAELERANKALEREIAEHGRDREALKASDERLGAFIENAPDAVFVHDVKGKLLNVNRKAEELCGYSKEEVIGKSVFDLGVLPHGNESWTEALLRSMGEGIIGGPYEFQLRRKDGGSVSVEAYAFPVIRDWGMDIVGIAKDITERRRTEEALRHSEGKYRSLVEQSLQALLITQDDRPVFVNAPLSEIAGYTQDEMLSMSLLDVFGIIHPDDLEDIKSRYFVRKDGESYRRVECRIVRKDGAVRWVDTYSSLIVFDGRTAVQTAFLDITARKAADEALRASEEKLRLMFESIEDGIFVVDLRGNVSEVNDAVTRMTGYSKQELLQGKMLDYVVPEYRDLTVQGITRAITDGRTRGKVEFPITVAGGRTIEIEASAALLRDGQGNPIGLIGTVRDVTERKRADRALRESEERYRLLAENVSDVIWTMNMNLEFTYISPSVIRMIKGYTLEELKTITMQELLTPEALSTAAKVAKEELALEGTGKADPYRSRMSEVELRNKDGSTIWAEVKASAIRDQNGKAVGFLGVVRDITERRRTDGALRESEERYRLLAENVSDVIWTMDMNLRFTYISPSVRWMLRDYTLDDIKNMKVQALITPQSFVKAMELLAEELAVDGDRAVDPYRSQMLEMELKHKDGSTLWTEVKASFIRDQAGKPVGILGVTRDITERRKAEAALRESEERYRLLAENVSDVIWIMDFGFRYLYVSPSIERTRGFTPDEAKSMAISDQVDPESLELAIKMLSEELELERSDGTDPQRIRTLEIKEKKKDGSWMWAELNVSFVRDGKGRPVGILGVTRDIDERKKAEEALKSSEEYFRAITENSSDMIIITDKKGNIKYCSLSVERFTGYKPEELIGKSAFEVIHPDDVQRAIADFGRAILIKDSSIPNTFRILHKDGSERVLDGLGKNLLDNPSIEGFIMNVRDITERKKAEEALRSSEKKYRDLVEREKDVICAVDTLGFITSINSAVSTWGYAPEELVGTNFLGLIAPEWRERTAIELQGRLLEAGEYIGETAAIDKNGEHRPIEYSATVIKEDGKYAGARAIVRDIAERKKAEEKIERQARRFEALHTVAQVISESMNLEKMLSGALAKACDAMDIDSGCIFLLDFSNKALQLEAYKGVSEHNVRRLSTVMLTDEGLDILMEMKKPVTVLDESLGVADLVMIQNVAAEIGARSIAAVPFFRGMDVHGVLVIFATQDRVFSKDDLDLLTSIGNEIAVGVDNIKLLERTREMSVTDELTGLYNRRHFFAMLEAEMNRAQRSGRPFSLVMLDLDGFKEYNDKFGHTNGDTILQVLAKTLRSSMRKSDMAFRYGGDEFAIVIPAAGAQKALKIVERARVKWQKAPRKQALVFESRIGFSTGIAEFPANAESADGLVFLADAALYQAKRLGGFTDKLVSDLRTLSPEILDVATQDQVYALAATVDARDPYTYGHSKRVAGIAVKIGKSIGMSQEEIAKLHAAALLHDIGKVGVPDAILTKGGPPTPEEWAVVKRHCAEGARIVGYVKELSSIVPVILHHHEWYDGTGYPDGLKGSDIPLGARITSVADAYDTMITQRPYRHIVAVKEACRELRRCAAIQFDPELVEVWCKMVEEAEKEK